MLSAPKEDLIKIIRETTRFGEKYALSKYDAICAAAEDAAVFGRALPSSAIRIRLYIETYREYQKHLDSILEEFHKAVDGPQGKPVYDRIMAALNNLKVDRSTKTPVNPVIHRYYTNKCQSRKKNVAVGAVMHKICNIIFAMLRDNKPFEMISPQEHCNRYEAEQPPKAGNVA